MSGLRAGLRLAGFVAVTLPLMPLQQLFVWFWPRMARNFPMHYHRLVLRILGVSVDVHGLVLDKGPAILASNHVSWLDIVILSSLAPLSFVAKRDVNAWPFFGSLARLQRTVFVDRDRRQTIGASLDEMRNRLKKGDILVLFAEGTSGDGARVLPFKSAFFTAAEGASIPVQPLSIAYKGHRNLPMTRRQRPLYAWYGDMDLGSHLWRALASGPIEVKIICHPMILASESGGRKNLANDVERSVRRGLIEALHGRGNLE